MGHHTVSTMITNTPLTLSLLLAASVHGFPSLNQTETKAASNLVNCGCQCSSLTFRDAKGEGQGNCLTVDSTGAQWCYVDSEYSSCQDLVPSLRFPNNPWSYEACATPAPGSLLCPLLRWWWVLPMVTTTTMSPPLEMCSPVVTTRSPSVTSDREMRPARSTCPLLSNLSRRLRCCQNV